MDIITVGGSTTDRRFLDDSLTNQQALKSKLAADGKRIANAGIDVSRPWAHQQLSVLVRQNPGLVGINDVLRVGTLGEFNSVNTLSARLRP